MEIIWLHTGHENHRALLTWNLVHESNFHDALVINRWSNYSTYRYISAKHSWRIYFIGARLWCSTACEKKKKKKKLRSNATDVRKFVGHSPITSLYTLFPLSLSKPALKLFCFEFFSYREKKKVLFFLSTNFFRFFFSFWLVTDSIYFNGPRVVPAIRLRMTFHGIMGHSLWKFLNYPPSKEVKVSRVRDIKHESL